MNNSKIQYKKFTVGQSNNYDSNINIVFDIPLPLNIDSRLDEQKYCENTLESIMLLFKDNSFSVVNGVYQVKNTDSLIKVLAPTCEEPYMLRRLSENELNTFLNQAIYHERILDNHDWCIDFTRYRFDPRYCDSEPHYKVLPNKIIRIIIVVDYMLMDVHTVQPDFTEIQESIKSILRKKFRENHSDFFVTSPFGPRFDSIFMGRIKEILIDYTKINIGMLPKGKWECKYCEGMNDDADNSCSHCGAARTRDCMSWETIISDNVKVRDLSIIE